MKIKGTFSIVPVDDSSVAVPLESDTFYTNRAITLNATAEEIFRALMEDTTEEEVTEKLAAKYTETSKEDIAKYVHKFVGELRAADLLD